MENFAPRRVVTVSINKVSNQDMVRFGLKNRNVSQAQVSRAIRFLMKQETKSASQILEGNTVKQQNFCLVKSIMRVGTKLEGKQRVVKKDLRIADTLHREEKSLNETTGLVFCAQRRKTFKRITLKSGAITRNCGIESQTVGHSALRAIKKPQTTEQRRIVSTYQKALAELV